MKNKRTLFHIVKREALPWYQAWMIRGAAILLALWFALPGQACAKPFKTAMFTIDLPAGWSLRMISVLIQPLPTVLLCKTRFCWIPSQRRSRQQRQIHPVLR